MGVGLTASADDAHLEEAYGVFAAEARDVEPEYAPETVNTDGWASTRNAFQTLFPRITVVLCFLHGFLKIRDRCRKACELHRRVWDVYRAATAEEFRRLMNSNSRPTVFPWKRRLYLISHFANPSRKMLLWTSHLNTWTDGVARHGACSR